MALTQEQIEFFNENSFLRLERVYSPEEVEDLSRELDCIIERFSTTNQGWAGPWRKVYLKDDEDEKAQLTHIHELHHFSQAWARAVINRKLVEAIADLIGPEVELHHSTLHAKTGGGGMPFPCHQDYPFYPHENGQYLDAIVHIDGTDENNGCLRFLAGSHKLGALEHIMGPDTAPHLPTDKYRLADTVSCPADGGDVVLFSIHTVHGSAINHSPKVRRVVRFGYRNPRNRQIGGQAMGRPGIMVHGVRPVVEGVEVNVYGNWTPPAK